MSHNLPHVTGSRWPAPAKLNLFLHVTGRRSDGYHTLETIFQFLDLADEVMLRVRGDGQIRRVTDLADVPAEEDLVVRAARALKSKVATPLGVDIGITKRIPMGGGLGGGSSDAATTLVGLNQVWKLGFDVEALSEIGLTLGADVPVFVRGKASFASGVGEHLTPIVLEEPWYLVIYPGCSVPTKEVFGAPNLTRHTPPLKMRPLPNAGTGSTHGETSLLVLSSLLSQTGNDCEPVVRARYPQVDAALEWLSEFSTPRMTGTGSCIFAPFQQAQEAERVLSLLPNTGEIANEEKEAPKVGWLGFVTRGRNQSLLRSSLQNLD
uniref:4-diphosphocytidyl-2-C-methyl-D-erythritol kinase n=1 Tax=Candidatus Kentrum sp. TUN TaxID=2126343 RepID=A0A451AFI9_9GAMM|nr:MAG: 4-diphosphocytidyl-2-C-methyl-D-erythritol kinase [Candidatus Kentron sp. TUN]